MKEIEQPIERVFVIQADGRALVAFEAISHREARELPKEQWFRDELEALRSEGQPIWDREATLEARNATPDEVVEFKNATSSVQGDKDGIVLAYLIPLDGPA